MGAARALPALVTLSALLDDAKMLGDAKSYELVGQQRWPEGVRWPHCASAAVARHGHDDT